MELRQSDPLPTGITESYRTLVRMAECLSPRKINISDFLSIKVKDDNSRQIVEKILKNHRIKTEPPYINIEPKCF